MAWFGCFPCMPRIPDECPKQYQDFPDLPVGTTREVKFMLEEWHFMHYSWGMVGLSRVRVRVPVWGNTVVSVAVLVHCFVHPDLREVTGSSQRGCHGTG